MRELSDAELDYVSAEGFDINLDAAFAFRNAVLVSQANAGVISGALNSSSNIHNYNSANLSSISDRASIRQENMAAIVATEGNITGAQLNNENRAAIDAAVNQLDLNQLNTSMLIALNGSIINSRVNNLNEAVITGSVGTANINQQNITVVIASGAMDAAINNINRLNLEAGSANINQASSLTHTFSSQGYSGIITVNNN